MLKNKRDSDVSAVVLAAGASTRMGTIKQLLKIGSEPMLQQIISVLKNSTVKEILIVLGHSAELIQQQIRLEAVTMLINESYREGMSSSLRIGLANVSPDSNAALIVLGDQPFLRTTTVDRLIREYRKTGALIVMPVYQGARGNPVLLDRSLFPQAAALTGDVGFRAIFTQYEPEILKVPVDDPGILADLDTAADVEKWARPVT